MIPWRIYRNAGWEKPCCRDDVLVAHGAPAVRVANPLELSTDSLAERFQLRMAGRRGRHWGVNRAVSPTVERPPRAVEPAHRRLGMRVTLRENCADAGLGLLGGAGHGLAEFGVEIIADEGSCLFFELPAAAVVGRLVPDRQPVVEIGDVTGDGKTSDLGRRDRERS